jgi:hypothetical protein
VVVAGRLPDQPSRAVLAAALHRSLGINRLVDSRVASGRVV